MSRFLNPLCGAAIIALTIGLAPVAHADPTPECNDGAASGSTECGSDAYALAENSLAVGDHAAVPADSEGGVSIGYYTQMTTSPGGVAIGRSALVNGPSGFGTINVAPMPDIISGVAVGDRARVSGANGTAYGGYAVVGVRGDFTSFNNGTAIGAATLVSADGGTALGALSTVSGENGIAIGNSVSVANAGAIAIGTGSGANTDNATALGTGAIANGANSVALGAGSIADRDNSVSVGTAGGERQITNVAAGTAATDAVNVAQLDAAVATANGSAVAAQATADTAREEAATALGVANGAQTAAGTALAQNAALGQTTATALGAGASFDNATGAVTAPTYAVQGGSYHDVGSAIGALDSGLSQLDTRVGLLELSNARGFQRVNGGIAAAMALGGTMIVPDSDVSMSFNLATYRGEQGFSGALVVRAAPRVYINGGFAGSTRKGSTGGRVGVAFGF